MDPDDALIDLLNGAGYERGFRRSNDNQKAFLDEAGIPTDSFLQALKHDFTSLLSDERQPSLSRNVNFRRLSLSAEEKNSYVNEPHDSTDESNADGEFDGQQSYDDSDADDFSEKGNQSYSTERRIYDISNRRSFQRESQKTSETARSSNFHRNDSSSNAKSPQHRPSSPRMSRSDRREIRSGEILKKAVRERAPKQKRSSQLFDVVKSNGGTDASLTRQSSNQRFSDSNGGASSGRNYSGSVPAVVVIDDDAEQAKMEADSKVKSLTLRITGQLQTIRVLETQLGEVQQALKVKTLQASHAEIRLNQQMEPREKDKAAHMRTKTKEELRLQVAKTEADNHAERLKAQIESLLVQLADEVGRRQRAEERGRALKSYADKAKVQLREEQLLNKQMTGSRDALQTKIVRHKRESREHASEASCQRSLAAEKVLDASRQKERADEAEAVLRQTHIDMEKLRDESEGYKLETARTHSKLRTLQGEMELVREREAARRAELRLSSMGAKCADQDSDQNIDHPRDRSQDRYLDRDRNRNRDRDSSHVDKRSRERDRERVRGRAPSVSTDADSDSSSGPTHNSSNSSVSRKDKGKGRERNRGRDGDGTVQSEVPYVQTVQRDRRDNGSFGIPHPRPLHTQSATPPRRPHYTVPSSPSSSSLSSAVIAGRVTYPVGRHSFSRGSSMDADIRSAASVTSTADSDCQSLYEGQGQGQAVMGRVGLEHSASPATSRHFSDHDLQHYEKHSSSSNRSRGIGELSSAHTLDAVDAHPPRPPSQRDSCSPTGGDVPSSSFKMQRETDQPNIRISFNRLRDTNGIPSRSKDILMRDRNTDRDIDVVKGENTDTSTAKQPISLNSRIGSRSMVNSSMVERAERLLSREASEERHRVREPHPPPPLSLPLSLPLPTSVPTSSAYLREPGSPYNLRAGNTSPSCSVEPKPMSGMGPLHAVTSAPLTNNDIYGMDSASLTATAREREREVREKEREVKEKVQWEKESEKESDEKVGVVARFDRLQSMFERVTGSAAPAMRRDSDSSDSDD